MEKQRAEPSRGTDHRNAGDQHTAGGVEVAVRYVTRASERFVVRAKLYKSAVDLLGQGAHV
jgi:hypothetical protein